MRFLIFGEHDPAEAAALEKPQVLFMREREKNPGKYPRIVLDLHYLASELPRQTERQAWVAVVDAEDPKQLADYKTYFYTQEEHVKSHKVHFIPLVEVNSATDAEHSYLLKLMNELQATQ